MGFVILAIIGIAFIVIITNISVVQQSRAYVIERLGAFTQRVAGRHARQGPVH